MAESTPGKISGKVTLRKVRAGDTPSDQAASSTELSKRLKIASITNCRACQVARKSDAVSEEDIACLSWDDPRFTPAEQAALRYAELFAGDYFAIDEDVYAELERHFSTAEIVELNLFAALMLAGGRMTYVQRGYPEDEDA